MNNLWPRNMTKCVRRSEIEEDEALLNFIDPCTVGLAPSYWSHIPMLIRQIKCNLIHRNGIELCLRASPERANDTEEGESLTKHGSDLSANVATVGRAVKVVPVSKCHLRGFIVAVERKFGCHAFVLDDGTGLIDCRYYSNNKFQDEQDDSDDDGGEKDSRGGLKSVRNPYALPSLTGRRISSKSYPTLVSSVPPVSPVSSAPPLLENSIRVQDFLRPGEFVQVMGRIHSWNVPFHNNNSSDWRSQITGRTSDNTIVREIRVIAVLPLPCGRQHRSSRMTSMDHESEFWFQCAHHWTCDTNKELSCSDVMLELPPSTNTVKLGHVATTTTAKFTTETVHTLHAVHQQHHLQQPLKPRPNSLEAQLRHPQTLIPHTFTCVTSNPNDVITWLGLEIATQVRERKFLPSSSVSSCLFDDPFEKWKLFGIYCTCTHGSCSTTTIHNDNKNTMSTNKTSTDLGRLQDIHQQESNVHVDSEPHIADTSDHSPCLQDVLDEISLRDPSMSLRKTITTTQLVRVIQDELLYCHCIATPVRNDPNFTFRDCVLWKLLQMELFQQNDKLKPQQQQQLQQHTHDFHLRFQYGRDITQDTTLRQIAERCIRESMQLPQQPQQPLPTIYDHTSLVSATNTTEITFSAKQNSCPITASSNTDDVAATVKQLMIQTAVALRKDGIVYLLDPLSDTYLLLSRRNVLVPYVQQQQQQLQPKYDKNLHQNRRKRNVNDCENTRQTWKLSTKDPPSSSSIINHRPSFLDNVPSARLELVERIIAKDYYINKMNNITDNEVDNQRDTKKSRIILETKGNKKEKN